jgi:hypothetical protein
MQNIYPPCGKNIGAFGRRSNAGFFWSRFSFQKEKMRGKGFPPFSASLHPFGFDYHKNLGQKDISAIELGSIELLYLQPYLERFALAKCGFLLEQIFFSKRKDAGEGIRTLAGTEPTGPKPVSFGRLGHPRLKVLLLGLIFNRFLHESVGMVLEN